MSRTTTETISIGAIAAVAVVITSTIAPAPVWVLFAAWAAAFLVGPTLRQTFEAGLHLWVGVAIGTAVMAAAAATSNPLVPAVLVGVGSALAVQLARLRTLHRTPLIVIGFALTVSTIVTSADSTPAAAGVLGLQTAVTITGGLAAALLSTGLATIFSATPAFAERALEKR